MIAIETGRNHEVTLTILLLGVASSLAIFPLAATAIPRQFTRLFILDSYSILYMAMLLCATAYVLLFGYDYLKRRQEHREEFYVLVLLATTGAMVLVVSRHFTSFFLGFELLS